MKTYIYAHINPETAEIVYIGSGSHYRAWSNDRKRSEPHWKFLNNLDRMGFTPADWTVILDQNMDERAARSAELRLIKTVRPMFNRMGISAANAGRGEQNRNSVLSPEVVLSMRRDFEIGLAIRAIARRHGVAYSTARKVVRGESWVHLT